MTTEERLREAAQSIRTRHPRPVSCGQYVDELMIQAADELLQVYRTIGELSVARHPATTIGE